MTGANGVFTVLKYSLLKPEYEKYSKSVFA